MQFTALLTGNRRDTNTGSPKALLNSIIGLERDHCWVDLTPEIEVLQPRGHHKAIKVSFDAEIKDYLKQGSIQQQTLCSITNLKRKKK